MNPVQFKLLRMLAAVFYTPLLLLWNHGAIVDAQNYQCADGSMPYGERCFQLYEYSAVTWAEVCFQIDVPSIIYVHIIENIT